MGHWSAANATEAYLKTMKMGKRANEPDAAEFISAIAAGNNAQLMVVACASTTGLTTSSLIAAFHQTGGRLIFIVKGDEDLQSSKQSLNTNTNHVEFIVGNAQSLLSNELKSADFVVIDCTLDDHEQILESVQHNNEKGAIVLGYNACWKDSWVWGGLNSRLLPIGEGLLLMRVTGKSSDGGGDGGGRRRRWVVKIDQCTGEEHVYRIKSARGSRGVKA